MTTTTYPNGQTLTSSALTLDEINKIIQPLVATMLGIASTDPTAYSKVRVAFQRFGQPGFDVGEDICSVRCSEIPLAYNAIRNVVNAANDDVSLTQVMTYQRTWEVYISFYGPNSNDRARLIKSSLLLGWVHDALVPSNLYLVTALRNVQRAPEIVNGQWQERSDFSFQLNEGVTETITVPTIASVEVTVVDPHGQQSAITT